MKAVGRNIGIDLNTRSKSIR